MSALIKNSAGPWGVGTYIPSERFKSVELHTAVFNTEGVVVALCGPVGDEQTEIDAALIAASPSLLEASMGLLSALQTRMIRTGATATEEKAFWALRAAIKSARGTE